MKGYKAAAYAAIDAGAKTITGVPGSPTTPIMEYLLEETRRAEWSVNEKVAVELGLGASTEGRRAMTIMKHVGLNVASDPLITAGTKGVGGGFVVLVGDDPGARGSQNEQDTRLYGPLLEGPMLDPSTPQELYEAVKEAFHLSEEEGVPAIVRYTARLGRMTGEILREEEDPVRATYDPMWSLTRVGRHQRLHHKREPRIKRRANQSGLNQRWDADSNVGVVSSGYPSNLVPEGVGHLSLTYVHPLPGELIEDFTKRYGRVLVVEETEPYLETRISGAVGRLTGHLPRTGPTTQEDITWALDHIDEDHIRRPYEEERVKHGARGLCEDCPYTPVYRALKTIGAAVAADLGCMVLSAYPPYEIVDASYALGGAIALAAGFRGKGVALIGDHGFIHSGIPGLLDAMAHSRDVLAIILDNKAAAMTGGQPVQPDATSVVKRLAPGADVVPAASTSEAHLQDLILDRLGEPGVSIVVIQGRCPEE